MKVLEKSEAVLNTKRNFIVNYVQNVIYTSNEALIFIYIIVSHMVWYAVFSDLLHQKGKSVK